MRSGALRQSVMLQRPVTTPDGMGGSVVTWTPVTAKPIHAQIDPISGQERLAMEQIQSTLTHQITIRYLPGVVPSMRLVRVKGQQTYEIHSVQNIEMRNRTLQLLCGEIQVVGA